MLFQEFFHQNQLLYGSKLESHHHSLPPPHPPKKRASSSSEHAKLRDKMGESSHQQSRLGLKASVGEIVEVQGGHIVRSTGRKDRHSKVCTAKGPRDRRVRLAAHTAIQFYDVQDRLGYDRPSKAVDWLIKKAKAAIDELAQLPAWHPTATLEPQQKLEEQQHAQQQPDLVNSNDAGPSSERAVTMLTGDNEQQGYSSNPQNSSSFLPSSLDSDVIADTIKTFFPMPPSHESNSSAMQFPNFSAPDLLSRSSSNSQDLRLSLQSFQDPILLHHNTHQHQTPNSQSHVLLSGTPLGFDTWPEHHHQGGEFSRFSGGAAASAGYFFNSPPAPQPMLQQLFGQNNQFFSQRGPLQSSNTPSVRAWIDPSISMADQHHPGVVPLYPSSVSGIGFGSGYGGFPGFHIPARIQGDEEEHDGYSDKLSSASSDSHH